MLRFRKKDSKELIKRMAKTNGCSVSEIRREMQYAIDEARNSDDPDAFCTLWRSQMRFRAVALRSITAARF